MYISVYLPLYQAHQYIPTGPLFFLFLLCTKPILSYQVYQVLFIGHVPTGPRAPSLPFLPYQTRATKYLVPSNTKYVIYRVQCVLVSTVSLFSYQYDMTNQYSVVPGILFSGYRCIPTGPRAPSYPFSSIPNPFNRILSYQVYRDTKYVCIGYISTAPRAPFFPFSPVNIPNPCNQMLSYQVPGMLFVGYTYTPTVLVLEY